MARRKGLRSSNDARPWKCPSCHKINPPTKHKFFKLPAFQCTGSGCKKKFKGNFKICLGEIKATGKSLVGEVFDQGQTRFCVPYAYAKLAEITERVSCIKNGDDPDLVEPINPLDLQNKFEKKFPTAVLSPKCLTKDFGLHRVLHMGLILRAEGVQRVDSGDLYKAVEVSTIPRDSFEEICQNLAEGIPMLTTYIPGKRRSVLRYCQIYKSPQCKSAQIGHAVVIIGAGMKRGKRFFYFLNSWGENFCPRRNIQGHIIAGGIGKIKESDLTKNLVKLTDQAGDNRRLDDQRKLEISRCNHLLFTLLKNDYNEKKLKNLRGRDIESDALDDGIFRDDEDCMSAQSVSNMQGLVKGMDLYFRRHDGQAVTCEYFYADSCNANIAQLPNFLQCQEMPSTLYRPVKETMLMPVSIGLADSSGKHMSTTIDSDGMLKTFSSDGQPVFSSVLQFNKKEQEFIFNNIPARPVSSLLKGCSAPVRLDSDLTQSDLIDSDKFNRWEVGRVLGRKLMLSLVIVFHQQKALALNPKSVDRLGAILCRTKLDKEFIAQAVTMPCQSEIMDMTPVANYSVAHAVCTFLKKELVFLLKDDLVAVTSTTDSEDNQINHDSMSHRALKHTCLASSQGQVRAVALLDFYNKWQHDHMAYLLIGGFCGSPVNFHIKDGVGYKFLGEVVLLLDGINPQVASRVVSAFSRWRRHDEARQALAKAQLEMIGSANGLAQKVHEIAPKSLPSSGSPALRRMPLTMPAWHRQPPLPLPPPLPGAYAYNAPHSMLLCRWA